MRFIIIGDGQAGGNVARFRTLYVEVYRSYEQLLYQSMYSFRTLYVEVYQGGMMTNDKQPKQQFPYIIC